MPQSTAAWPQANRRAVCDGDRWSMPDSVRRDAISSDVQYRQTRHPGHLARPVQAALGAADMPELQPGQVTAIIDSREQNPLDLSPIKSICSCLQTGDYSVAGLEHLIAIERKSLQDLVGCCGRDRDRFVRELHRLRSYPVRMLVIESTLAEIECRQYRGATSPQSIIGSLLAWQTEGLPVLMAGDHQTAGKMVARLLFIAARRYYRQLQAFADSLDFPSHQESIA